MASRTEKLSFERRATQRLARPLLRPRTIQGGFCMQQLKITFTICLGLAVMLVSIAALLLYQRLNLVLIELATASHTNLLIVYAWGLVYWPGSPSWISAA